MEVEQQYPSIRQAGGDVLVVSFTRPERLDAYLARYPIPLPVVTDPTLQAYRAFELGRASWWALLRPRVLWRYLRLLIAGWRLREYNPEEDIFQLGGDFVLDRDRRLIFAYRSSDPADRPEASTLIAALRSAA